MSPSSEDQLNESNFQMRRKLEQVLKVSERQLIPAIVIGVAVAVILLFMPVSIAGACGIGGVQSLLGPVVIVTLLAIGCLIYAASSLLILVPPYIRARHALRGLNDAKG